MAVLLPSWGFGTVLRVSSSLCTCERAEVNTVHSSVHTWIMSTGWQRRQHRMLALSSFRLATFSLWVRLIFSFVYSKSSCCGAHLCPCWEALLALQPRPCYPCLRPGAVAGMPHHWDMAPRGSAARHPPEGVCLRNAICSLTRLCRVRAVSCGQ